MLQWWIFERLARWQCRSLLWFAVLCCVSFLILVLLSATEVVFGCDLLLFLRMFWVRKLPSTFSIFIVSSVCCHNCYFMSTYFENILVMLMSALICTFFVMVFACNWKISYFELFSSFIAIFSLNLNCINFKHCSHYIPNIYGWYYDANSSVWQPT